ncbi:hypothetical protein [Actinomyces mediterranea]|uniref:hypothetical protein n=1 Tax=Actinomyces mediterranea TaxID=1871028 RepID=UPI0013564294|nr:hypothetical protein [Actinomyces mediterranea]
MRSGSASPTSSAMSDSFAASRWKHHLVMMLHFNGILAQGPRGGWAEREVARILARLSE